MHQKRQGIADHSKEQEGDGMAMLARAGLLADPPSGKQGWSIPAVSSEMCSPATWASATTRSIADDTVSLILIGTPGAVFW